jgi:hypothetical protein
MDSDGRRATGSRWGSGWNVEGKRYTVLACCSDRGHVDGLVSMTRT